MSTTASSTRAWTRPVEVRGLWRLRVAAWLLACLSLLPAAWGQGQAAAPPTVAETPAPAAQAAATTPFTLVRESDGLYVDARANIKLAAAVEDALSRGIVLHFVLLAEVAEPRWYWSDKVLAQAARTLRLSYHPLTRRWRLSVTPGLPADSGLGLALHQNHESLAEALSALGRVRRWKVADAAALAEADTASVHLSLALDPAMLPRPLQIGLAGAPEWNLTLEQTLPLPLPPAADVAGPASPPGVDDETPPPRRP